MSGTINAPWTADQVQHLNAFQRSGRFHPFTCGRRSEHAGDDVLVATADGWVCPAEGCEYRQSWASAFMAQPLPPPDPRDFMARAREENRRGREALAAVARIRALHQPYRSVYDEGDNRSCAHCNQLTGYAVPYPCDTVKALDDAPSDRSDSTPEGEQHG